MSEVWRMVESGCWVHPAGTWVVRERKGDWRVFRLDRSKLPPGLSFHFNSGDADCEDDLPWDFMVEGPSVYGSHHHAMKHALVWLEADQK